VEDKTLPIYHYKAKDQSGQEIVADIQAADSQEALAKVMEKGLFPLSIRERAIQPKQPKPKSDLDARPKKTAEPNVESNSSFWLDKLLPGSSLKTIVYFTRQLAALQDAGLTILRSLQLLYKQLPPGRFRAVVERMSKTIESGRTLTEAMSEHPKDFDPVYIKMVQAGEIGGFLEKTLVRIADAKEKTLRLRRKVIQSMIYPVLVCSVACLILIGIIEFIIPMIMGDASNAGGPLGSIVRVEKWFTRGGFLLIAAIPFLWNFVTKKFRTMAAVRAVWDQLVMDIPIIGKFFYKLSVVRFSRVLGSLVGAGVPIIQALESTRDVTGNEVFARATDMIHDQVIEGANLTKAVANTRVFDPAVLNIIEVGEETGDLDKVLLKLADNYQEELDYHVGYMMTILEVSVIVVMCLFIGYLVVTLYANLIGGAINAAGG
jgi:type IV pilus assembly protein PilC